MWRAKGIDVDGSAMATSLGQHKLHATALSCPAETVESRRSRLG
jgi:hypothetical protein